MPKWFTTLADHTNTERIANMNGEIKTLGDELPKQIARVKELITVYESLPGKVGFPAAHLMRVDVNYAERVTQYQDVVGMMQAHEKLKGWKE